MFSKNALHALSRHQIIEFFGLTDTTKATKTQLIQQLYDLMEQDQQLCTSLLQAFPDELAMGPNEVQQFLCCTTAERKRWIYEGKLRVLYYRIVEPIQITYPMHERAALSRISPDDVAAWRAEYEQALRDTGLNLSRVRYAECLDLERVAAPVRSWSLFSEHNHTLLEDESHIAAIMQSMTRHKRVVQER